MDRFNLEKNLCYYFWVRPIEIIDLIQSMLKIFYLFRCAHCAVNLKKKEYSIYGISQTKNYVRGTRKRPFRGKTNKVCTKDHYFTGCYTLIVLSRTKQPQWSPTNIIEEVATINRKLPINVVSESKVSTILSLLLRSDSHWIK